ncbi:MAG TPA: AAA family ATPase [Mycobacterium sp.]|nr:AAA family ATPase [Mycobacterium sp.]
MADLVRGATEQSAALILEGDPGIGKTTMWLSGLEAARNAGFRVLSARPAEAETVMAYASLADLLDDVDDSTWAALPQPQRLAIEQILLRTENQEVATHQRAVAAAVRSAIDGLAQQAPVLLAIDDLQWLDPSSRQVLAFVIRRLPERASVFVTVRTDASGSTSWLQLPRPEAVRHVRVGPMSLGGLHELISQRLRRSFSRPTMVRIHEISGGNPFYALELARSMRSDHAPTDAAFPRSLSELVRERIHGLDNEVRDILLAASCVPEPTVDVVARVSGRDTDSVVVLLADAERKGIIGIDGARLRFSHPLLARGVYLDAEPGLRRQMHRLLADIVRQPELRARHLALAATSGDALTLGALDAAAESAHRRGAPVAAAELVDMAIRLGGDNPQRRILLAGMYFAAGEPARAREILEQTVNQLVPSVIRAEALLLLAIVRFYHDSNEEGGALVEAALRESADNVDLRVRALVMLSFAQLNANHVDTAVHTADDAVAEAEKCHQLELLSQALGMREVARFMRGDGVDERALARAVELEDPKSNGPLALRPNVQKTLVMAWTGNLSEAHDEMLAIQRHCIQHGQEEELIFVGFHFAQLQVWRGDFARAADIAEETTERASQLAGHFPLFIAHTVNGIVATYGGRVDHARAHLTEALAAGARSGAHRMAECTIAVQGFLEVSLGNYEAAIDVLQPLLEKADAMPQATEIISAPFIPDAVEALVHLGRLGVAERYVKLIERNGRRLDRAWMLAVGAHCRSMVLGAHGDLEAAIEVAREAISVHARLQMPFELARSQLLLGQLQRRQRHRDMAAQTLGDALERFEMLNAPLWAARVRGELARAESAPSGAAVLTVNEQKLAELAASGMTNRDVAAQLYISTKTVEATLSRVYRKLGIHSRGQLGQYIARAAHSE